MAYVDIHGVKFEDLPSHDTPIDAANLNKIQNDLAEYVDSSIPAGRLMWDVVGIEDDGWLIANGQQVTTDYPVLRDKLITAGSPHGSSGGNPLLPNLVGKFARGSNVPGGTGGADSVTLSQAQMPVHTHTQNAHTHVQDAHNHSQNSHTHAQDPHTHTPLLGQTRGGPNQGSWDFNWTAAGAAGGLLGFIQLGGGVTSALANSQTTAMNHWVVATNNAATATNQNTTATNQNAGGGSAHENRPAFVELTPLIRAY